MEKPEMYVRRKTLFRLGIGLSWLILLIVGISSCNLPNVQGIISTNPATEVPDEVQVSPTPLPTATPQATPVRSRNLIVWIPPRFDSGNGSTSSNLFLSRLDEFTSRRPQTDIQVRVKALSGEFGILESLRAAKAAAPIIAPDLIVLPRSLMEEAVSEGLVVPLNELTEIMDQENWYPYAKEMSQVDGEVFGIPFAGDLLILAYKNDSGENPPQDWDELLNSQRALAFPASDPRSMVTLAQYRSLGGSLESETGDVNLERDVFLEVLTHYQNAQAANVMPYWITQFETDGQAWQSYQERQATLAITWSSTMLGFESSNTALAAMPNKEGKAFALADGWIWCVIPSDPDTEEIAIELVEFITADSYLSTWTVEAGYLPVRPSGLEAWSDVSYHATLGQLLPSAVILPSNDTVNKLGPLVRDAVVAVLKDQAVPTTVVNELFPSTQDPD